MVRIALKIFALTAFVAATQLSAGVVFAKEQSADTVKESSTSKIIDVGSSSESVQINTSSQVANSDDVLVSSKKEKEENSAIGSGGSGQLIIDKSQASDETSVINQLNKLELSAAAKGNDGPDLLVAISSDLENMHPGYGDKMPSRGRTHMLIAQSLSASLLYHHSISSTLPTIPPAPPKPNQANRPETDNALGHLGELLWASGSLLMAPQTSPLKTFNLNATSKRIEYIDSIFPTIFVLAAIVIGAIILMIWRRNKFRGAPRSDIARITYASYARGPFLGNLPVKRPLLCCQGVAS